MKTRKTKINQWVAVALFALITFGGNVSAKGTEVTASGRENIKEPALQMESWITDNKTWDLSNSESLMEQENVLQLEEWMTNENNWIVVAQKNYNSEKDAPIMLESWMMDDNYWLK